MKTNSPRQLGMVGLGRIGANMVRRLLKTGHRRIAFDRSPKAIEDPAKEGAVGQDKLLSAVRFGFGGHLEKSVK